MWQEWADNQNAHTGVRKGPEEISGDFFLKTLVVCLQPTLSASLGVMCVEILPKVGRGLEGDSSESLMRTLGNLCVCGVVCVWCGQICDSPQEL